MTLTLQRPIKLGIVSTFPPGKNSLSEYGWFLVRALASQPNVEHVTVFSDESPLGSSPVLDGVTVRPCWEFNSAMAVPRILHEIRRSNVDAVLFNLQFASFGDHKIPAGLGLLLPALLKQLNVPTGVILHNLFDEVDLAQAAAASNSSVHLLRAVQRPLTQAILQADYTSVTLPKYDRVLRERYGATRSVVIPHGSFHAPAEPQFGLVDGPKRVLAFGKFGTYKRIEPLIQAHRRLLAEGRTDIELVIAGTDHPKATGYLSQIAPQCRDLPSIRFTGYVPEERVPTLFRSAATVVFPYTSTTGSSGVLHQAGSYGRSAVLPSIGDFVELIEAQGFVGNYFEPGDSVSLAQAIRTALDDTTTAREHGKRNFEAAAGVPMDQVAAAHVAQLRKACERRSRGARATTPAPQTSEETLTIEPATDVDQPVAHEAAGELVGASQ